MSVSDALNLNDTTSLYASSLPTGVTASFSPNSVTGAGTSTLTVKTSASTPAGSYTIRVNGNSSTVYHTATISLTVNASSGGALPLGWTDAHIGAVGLAGNAGYNSGTFTVSGSGSDIWNAADQFNYAYKNAIGDQTVIARVTARHLMPRPA